MKHSVTQWHARRLWRACAGCIVLLLSLPDVASAANMLQEARVRITMSDPVTCDVTVSSVIALDGGGNIEQRLQRLDGSRVDLLEVTGAEQTAPTHRVGLTEVLALRFPGARSYPYEVRYRVTQPNEWAYRCPVWLPTVATDGRSRNVQIEVVLPAAAQPAGGSFPALEWDRGIGRATLGHLPAFVRLPYAEPGQAHKPMRDVGRIMDFAAIGMLIAGTLMWVARRRR